MKLRLFAALALLCGSFMLSAQATVSPIVNPHQTFVDASGGPCAGCSLSTYTAGTTTPTPTWTDSSGGVQNTNPIILSVQGGANIWVSTNVSYKFVLKSPTGVTIWSVDNVQSPAGQNGDNIVAFPLTTQTITQPGGTNFNVNTSSGGKLNYNGNEVLTSATGCPTTNCVKLAPTTTQTIIQPAGTHFGVSGAMSSDTFTSGSIMPITPDPGTVTNLIWDDDCDTDPGCFMTQAALMHWVDAKQVNLLAVTADSTNPASAPAMKIILNYYGYTSIPVGAYQGGADSATGYSGLVVAQFNPGDKRQNYPSCINTMRTALAAAANSSVVLAGTGYGFCLRGLQTSPADGISPLTGEQLIQAKVRAYVQMGGDYPSAGGSGACNAGFPPAYPEFNFCDKDPADFSAMYAQWTTANSYPPIYFVGYTDGVNGGNAGIPTNFPLTNPAQYGVSVSGFPTRPSWDTLAVWFAIFGNVNGAFSVSSSGRNTVDPATGANTWASSPAAGQFYLTDAQPTPFYEQFLDGQTATGADWFGPYNQSGLLSYPQLQCSFANGCFFGGNLSPATIGNYILSYKSTNGVLGINALQHLNVLDLQQSYVSKLNLGVDDGTGNYINGAAAGEGGIRITSNLRFYFANAFGAPVSYLDTAGGFHSLFNGLTGTSMNLDNLSGGRLIATGASTTPTVANMVDIEAFSFDNSVDNILARMSASGFIQIGSNPSVGVAQNGNSTWTAAKITSLSGTGNAMACLDASGNLYRGTATTCP